MMLAIALRQVKRSKRGGQKIAKVVDFVDGIFCFWMKEMNFNLDIIWLNNLKKVDYFQKNLSPLTYPKLYCPPLNSRYVLEMNSGFVNKQHIHIGDKLNF